MKTWYLMLYTVDQYEKGEEYGSLPDDLMEDYPDSFEIIEEDDSKQDPFN